MLTRSTPAKINLFLNLQRLREDGFHEIASVMQAVAIYDHLTLEPIGTSSNENENEIKTETEASILLTTNHRELTEALAKDPADNLVVKAYHRFWEWTQKAPLPAKVHLEKNIPVQAGMGGGSSDAAAMLLLLNEWAETRLPKEELEAMAATLGSDVPFFIGQGTALAVGRGEVIRPVELLLSAPSIPLLVVKPKHWGISTALAYQFCREVQSYYKAEVTPLLEALETSKAASKIEPLLMNDFESVLFPKYPKLQGMALDMKSLGVVRPLLSGSGPTMVGFLPCFGFSEEDALQTFPSSEYHVFFTHTLPCPIG